MRQSKFPFFTALIALAAMIASNAPLYLQFDRQQQLEFWRLITSHLTHWSSEHLAWDLLVFIAIGAVCETRNRKLTLVTIAISSLAISGAVALGMPKLHYYRGLSGVDSALFALWSGWVFRESSDPGSRYLRATVLTFALLFLVKIAVELTTGAAIFVNSSASGFVPTPLAHLAGAVVGLVVAFMQAETPSRSPG
jgi:rhomboid family GlyGly-CTERM serine protease